MKKYAKTIALLFAVVLCVGIMTACTGNTDNDEDNYTMDDTGLSTNTGSDDDTVTDDATNGENEEFSSDLIGKVSLVTEESIYLTLYESNVKEIDYATLDFTTLTATGNWEEITVTEETAYWFMEAGTETGAALSDVTVDSIVAVTEGERGMQKIIILEKTKIEGVENLEAIFAEVESIAEDGTLTLMLYTLVDTEADTEVTNYTAIDWNDYVYSFDTMDYLISDSATIQFAGEYPLPPTDSTAIEVGTMLVIYQEESGSDTIIIYQNSNIAE